MLTGKDKYEYLDNIKKILVPQGFTFSELKEINYGLQFVVSKDSDKGIIRVYQSKKATRHDLSQIKDNQLSAYIESLLIGEVKKDKLNNLGKKSENKKLQLPDDLIGTDESGKGDYFGPLVVAGVIVNKRTSLILKELGITDSKKLNDKLILELALQVKALCPHSIVTIGNSKYNQLYKKIKNLNNLLAWGHARVIENILISNECDTVLSDQFGDEQLIKEALLDKGKEVKLYQMHRAEENIAVAAASILARSEYVNRMEQMKYKYGIPFPKGASGSTQKSAKLFVTKYGVNELENVAKLHFKTTRQVLNV